MKLTGQLPAKDSETTLPALLQLLFCFLNLLQRTAGDLPQCDDVKVHTYKKPILFGGNVEPAIRLVLAVNLEHHAPYFLITGHR